MPAKKTDANSKPEDKNEDLGLNIPEGSEENNSANKEADEISKLKAENAKAKKEAKEAKEAKERAEAELMQANNKSDEVANEKHDYWWVMFAAKDNPNASDQVILGVNGNILVIKRNVEVIVPSNYLDVADCAVAKQYRQLPGEERQIVGEVKTFPYTKLRPATKQQYLEMKAEGNKATKAQNNKKAND